MTLQDAGIIGDVVASIATVITLIYLAVQIRQNTHTMRVTSTTSHIESLGSTTLLLAQDRELSDIYFAGLSGEQTLDESEERQFQMTLAHFMMAIQQVYLLREEEALHPEIDAYLMTTLTWLMRQSGFRKYWEAWGPTNPPNFKAFIDEQLKIATAH